MASSKQKMSSRTDDANQKLPVTVIAGKPWIESVVSPGQLVRSFSGGRCAWRQDQACRVSRGRGQKF